MKLISIAAIAAVSAAAAVFAFGPQWRAGAQDDEPRVLVFSHTTGWRQDSIEPGAAALEELGEEAGWTVETTEDPTVFDASLGDYDALVLLNSTTERDDPDSEWFTGDRRAVLRDFVRDGGGIVGVHAAADSHYHWDWYGEMLGGAFRRHPAGTPRGAVTVEDGDHPATRAMPRTYERVDEWYYFDRFDPGARLLLSFDPASIGEPEAEAQPASWSKTFEGGRVFYTAFGHTRESFEEPLVREHLRGGLSWAMGLED